MQKFDDDFVLDDSDGLDQDLPKKEEENLKRKHYDLPHIIKLEFPVKWGKDDVRDTVTIKRRLQTKDVMSLPTENMKLGHMVNLVSKSTCEPLAFIKELDTVDLFSCIEVVKSFLPASPKNGGD